MSAPTPRKKKAAPSPITSIADIKARNGGIFVLPSGIVARLKNPGGMAHFLSGGSIPNALMSTVQTAMEADTTPDPNLTQEELDALEDKKKLAAAEKLIEDDAAMADMMGFLDKVAITCFVEPKVHPVPTEDDLMVWNTVNDTEASLDDLRKDDILYVDEIPLGDKQEIFKWVSQGVADLVPFRQ